VSPSTRVVVLFFLALAALSTGSAGAAGPNVYSLKSLVTDSTDPSLVNGWGLVAGPTTPWWTSNNGTNTSTLYGGAGNKLTLTVSVPGGPTGTVFNGSSSSFVVSQDGKSGAARFIFATEAGTILGWSSTVAATTAIPGLDRSSQGAVYKGLALLNDRLYATDFHNARVDMVDSSFNVVSSATAFRDKQIPKGWAPFGIAALGGNIYVTYARQDAARKDDVAGGGLGYVDEFTPDGALVARVAKRGGVHAPLNAPWGLALAPATFGSFAGDLLVGNFGDGRISAYQPKSGGGFAYKGQLRLGTGAPIVIDGLWGLSFGNGAAAGPADSLYFAAGPEDESHGALGVITAG
jgi:uncharacterized protein (TIGR03118 family)